MHFFILSTINWVNKTKSKKKKKTLRDSVNHSRFPKEDHLPESAGWDNQVKKGDRVEYEFCRRYTEECTENNIHGRKKKLSALGTRTLLDVQVASGLVRSYPIEDPYGMQPLLWLTSPQKGWIDFVCHPPCLFPPVRHHITSPLTTNIFLTFAQELRPIWDVSTSLSLHCCWIPRVLQSHTPHTH